MSAQGPSAATWPVSPPLPSFLLSLTLRWWMVQSDSAVSFTGTHYSPVDDLLPHPVHVVRMYRKIWQLVFHLGTLGVCVSKGLTHRSHCIFTQLPNIIWFHGQWNGKGIRVMKLCSVRRLCNPCTPVNDPGKWRGQGKTLSGRPGFKPDLLFDFGQIIPTCWASVSSSVPQWPQNLSLRLC